MQEADLRKVLQGKVSSSKARIAFGPFGFDSYCPAGVLDGFCKLFQRNVGCCSIAVENFIPTLAAGKCFEHSAQLMLDKEQRGFWTYSESSCIQLVKCATASSNFPAVNAVLPLTLMSAALPCVRAHFRSNCNSGLLSHVVKPDKSFLTAMR